MEGMPRRISVATSNLVKRRLGHRNLPNKKRQQSYFEGNYPTRDALVYHPNEKMLVVPNAAYLARKGYWEILPMKAEALSPDKDEAFTKYEFLKEQEGVVEIRKRDIESRVGRGLIKRSAKVHPVWRALIPDQDLLDEYTVHVFSFPRSHDGAMGIYPSTTLGLAFHKLEIPIIMPVHIGSTDYHSSITGWSEISESILRQFAA